MYRSRQDVIDDDFELNVASNEIGYKYTTDRNRRLFWSLPPIFTGNKVRSYGGALTMTQHITAYPDSPTLKDQDVLLFGNGITLFWTNPKEIIPGLPLVSLFSHLTMVKHSVYREISGFRFFNI